MNKYYLDIIENAGYRMMNPNKRFTLIYRKDDFKTIKPTNFHSYDESFIYEDEDSKKSIILSDKNNTMIYYDDNDKFRIDLGDYDKSDDYIILSGTIRGSENNHICFSIKCNPLDECFNCGSINFYIDDSKLNNIKNLVILQSVNKASVYNYDGNTSLSSLKASEIVLPKDCTLENYLSYIFDIIVNNEEIEKDIALQKGFKFLLPILTTAINDLIIHWQGYGVADAIRRKEKDLNELSKEKEELDWQINIETDSLTTMKSVLLDIKGHKRK